MKNLPRIGIVGAGMAGLSCGHALRNHGFEVTVIDKGRGLGGRMSLRRFHQWEADHGAQYFTAKSDHFKRQVDAWLDAGVISPWGGRIVEYSAKKILAKVSELPRYVGNPSMTAPAKNLANNLVIYLEKAIVELSAGSKGWSMHVKEADISFQYFDHIIVAIPPRQAFNLIKPHSSDLANVCERIEMMPCWALLAYFKEPLALDYDGAFIKDSLYSWIARNNSKPGRLPMESWVGHASNDWSLKYLDSAQYQVEPLLVDAFESIIGRRCDLYQSHLWRYAKLASTSKQEFLVDELAQISLCGDWLLNSTVEGAWLSGRKLANHLIKKYE